MIPALQENSVIWLFSAFPRSAVKSYDAVHGLKCQFAQRFSNCIQKCKLAFKDVPLLTVTLYFDHLQLCNSEKLAFYGSYGSKLQQFSKFLHIPCKIFTVNFGRVDSLCMVLTKDNQYTAVLSYQSVSVKQRKKHLLRHLITTFIPLQFAENIEFWFAGSIQNDAYPRIYQVSVGGV